MKAKCVARLMLEVSGSYKKAKNDSFCADVFLFLMSLFWPGATDSRGTE